MQYSASAVSGGDNYVVQITVPTEMAPNGTATVSDSALGSCASNAWNDDGSNGAGGFVYAVECEISPAEPVGATVSVAYAGTDYTTLPSNVMTIAGALTLSATTPVPSGGNYVSTVTATLEVAESDAAPSDSVLVELESGAAQCATSNLANPISEGALTSYSGTCVLTTVDPFQGAGIGSLVGSDYVTDVPTFSSQVTLNGSLSPAPIGSQYEMFVVVPAGSPPPTGTGTVADGEGGSCHSATWVEQTYNGYYGDTYQANCAITTTETAGDLVSATYLGGNYTFGESDVIDVQTLALTGSPVTSPTGNSYVVTLDQSDSSVPTQPPFVVDTNANSCTPSGWTSAGSDGSGGFLFTAQCSITSLEEGGTSVFATYGQVGSNHLTVASLAASLSLSGTPIPSVSGNIYTYTLDTPIDMLPLGYVNVIDSNSVACSSTSWTDEGADGHGGELFGASCSMTYAEAAGATVGATYGGTDYTSPTSNLLTVAAMTGGGSGSSGVGSGSTSGVSTTPPLAQVPLAVTSTSGHVGSALALTTTGGSGTGALSFEVASGTARDCVVSGDLLRVTNAGTCLVTATRSGDATYSSVSSLATVVTFALPSRPSRVTIAFVARKKSLSSRATTSLLALSRKLIPGASVTVRGYAKGSAVLARQRAAVAARYLERRIAVRVSIKASASATARGRVTVTTTSQ
jgi:hypothetical protein